MNQVSGTLLMLVGWLASIRIAAWLIGPERRQRWFRQRDLSTSLMNRRGLFGRFFLLGRPCTFGGWIVFAAVICMISASLCILLFNHPQ